MLAVKIVFVAMVVVLAFRLWGSYGRMRNRPRR